MKTWHENIGDSGKIIHEFRPHRDDLAKTGADGQVVFGFTV
jgi:hypothetical protein